MIPDLVPPVDADRFEFLYTLAMETSRAGDDAGFDVIIDRVATRHPDAMRSRFEACMEIMASLNPDLQMAAVRLAATFPLRSGEYFDPDAFASRLASVP